MPNKGKFKFVNDQESDIKVDSELVTNNTDVESKTSNIKEKRVINRHVKSAIIMFVISLLLFAFGIFWQDDYSLMAIGDALWLVFVIELFAGWILLVYNQNIFSPLLYGAKTFIFMFLGKRPKVDYYTYMRNVQQNYIEPYYYIVAFISAFIVLIPALITLFILI